MNPKVDLLCRSISLVLFSVAHRYQHVHVGIIRIDSKLSGSASVCRSIKWRRMVWQYRNEYSRCYIEDDYKTRMELVQRSVSRWQHAPPSLWNHEHYLRISISHLQQILQVIMYHISIRKIEFPLPAIIQN